MHTYIYTYTNAHPRTHAPHSYACKCSNTHERSCTYPKTPTHTRSDTHRHTHATRNKQNGHERPTCTSDGGTGYVEVQARYADGAAEDRNRLHEKDTRARTHIRTRTTQSNRALSQTEPRRGTGGECLPGAHPAHAQRATFVLSSLSLAPGLSSPREVPQVDRTRPHTFPARHLA